MCTHIAILLLLRPVSRRRHPEDGQLGQLLAVGQPAPLHLDLLDGGGNGGVPDLPGGLLQPLEDGRPLLRVGVLRVVRAGDDLEQVEDEGRACGRE